MTAKEKDDAMYKMLEEGIKSAFESENFKKVLETMSKFTSYSVNNIILLASQGATFPVASYKAWENKFNRHVIPGSQSLSIIAPCEVTKVKRHEVIDEDGKPVLGEDGSPQYADEKVKVQSFKRTCVFDITSTEGEPLAQICEDLISPVDGFTDYMEALQSVSPVPISFEDMVPEIKGYFDRNANEIKIQRGMPELQTLKTCLHEVGHSILHCKTDTPDFGTGMGAAQDASRELKELQAESIAFVVANRLGFDTSDYSFPYCASYAAQDRELKEYKSSLQVIKGVADRLYKGIIQSLNQQMELRDNAPKVENPQISTGIKMAI